MKRIISFTLFLCLVLGMKAETVYTIYPVPQEQVAGNGTASLTEEVNVICEPAIDQPTKDRLASILTEHGITALFSEAESGDKANIYLGVNGSGKEVDALANAWELDHGIFSLSKYDRHILSLKAESDGRAKLLILGENTDAVFMGLASLEQMLDGGHEAMPCVDIHDYADQMYRGLVEGYYGYPYSVTVKKDLMRFMMRHKMNTYLYGPKGDPYHAGYWRKEYPTEVTPEQEKNGWLTQEMVRDLSAESQKTKVNFVWAIHPGNDFIGNANVVSDILKKFDMMYQLGVRQFAIFVDDVNVPSSDADLQTNAKRLTEVQHGLENKYNVENALPADTVKPIHFVGQIYASSFAGEAVRKNYFNKLSSVPENVIIYTTGWGVWSVPNANDINVVKNDLGRDVAWWWNYPCNDNADCQIYPMDMYSNFYDMRSVGSNSTLPAELPSCKAVISNPMQQGEVSKIPLFSVADYAWNNNGFNNTESWNASFKAIVDEKYAEDYQFLAKYLRYNEPNDVNSEINAYKTSLTKGSPNSAALKERLQKVYDACMNLETLKDSPLESDNLLYDDLKPFLSKLKDISHSLLKFLNAADATEKGQMWAEYESVIETSNNIINDTYMVHALEGMGTGANDYAHNVTVSHNYLTPFVGYMRNNAIASHFSTEESNELKSFISIEGVRLTARKQGDVYYLNNAAPALLAKGDYMGIELPIAMKSVSISAQDTLLSKWNVVYSENGKEWNKLEATETHIEQAVKFVCVMNDSEEPRAIKLSKNALNITIPHKIKIVSAEIPEGEQYENCSIEALYDGNLSTYCILKRNMVTGDTYTMTLDDAGEITDVRLYLGTTNGDYPQKTKVEVSEDNVKWTALKLKGSKTTEFEFSDGTPTNDNQVYFDLSGKKGNYKYLRIVVAEAPSVNKWFRLAEVQVNNDFESIYGNAVCTDAENQPLLALYDRLPYTFDSPENISGKQIIYQLQGLKSAKDITFYHAAISEGKAMLFVSEDGTTWNEAGSLSGTMTILDLNNHPYAKLVKVTWTDEAPLIYEIEDAEDENSVPSITGIEHMECINGELNADFHNGAFNVSCDKNIEKIDIYNTSGQLLLSRTGDASKFMQIPLAEDYDIVIISAICSDGTHAATKIAFK